MIGIIVENKASKAPQVQKLLETGFTATEVEDLYERQGIEIIVLTRSSLTTGVAQYLNFTPRIACELTPLELRWVSFIQARFEASGDIVTNPEYSVLHQLYS